MKNVTRNSDGYRCTSDGRVDYGYYRAKGHRLRSEAFRQIGHAASRMARQAVADLGGR